MTESQEQIALFNFLRTMERQYPELKWIHSIPNGGHRHMVTAKKMKAEGVKAGVLDIFVPLSRYVIRVKNPSWPNGKPVMKHGLYIEMKFGKNTITDNQHEFADFVTEGDYLVNICYSWIEATKAIFDYLGLELPEGIE